MPHLDAESLIKKYQSGNCTPEEMALLEKHITFTSIAKDDISGDEDMLDELSYDVAQICAPAKIINWGLRLAIAAAILAFVAVTITLFRVKDTPTPPSYANDVKPGSNKAILTLANGKTINLSDAKNGALANDHNVEIIKSADGQLLFKFNSDAAQASNATKRDSIGALVSGASPVKSLNRLNCVTTPKGGQYHIALPDGTNVWVNAGSSLRFPSSFADMPERRVELTGEAYFEVAQIKTVFGMQKRARKMPFIVKTDRQEVTVLGTHFNINSYADEPNIRTTLLEGSVKVSSARGDAILKPGQQAVNDNAALKVSNVDTEMAVAWKNGEFMFRNESLKSIMRQIGRWYNVEVSFEDEQIGKAVLGGTITKYTNLSKVLCVLENTGSARFKVTGNKVIVTRAL